jgi:uncharacterized protein (TIGR03067 family)
MRVCYQVVLALLLPAIAFAQANDAKQLAGTWLPKEVSIGDAKLDGATLANTQLVIEADRYTVTSGESVDKGTLKFDAKATPKTMDIVGTEGPNKDKSILAIYELDGDKLTVCYSLEPGVRPAEFKSAGDSKRVLAKYERKK